MKYYIHTNIQVGQLERDSENSLYLVNSNDELFLKVRQIMFLDEEDETDWLFTDPMELINEFDYDIEISIFNEELKNIFNFGRFHGNRWIDFENFVFKSNESIINYSNYKNSL